MKITFTTKAWISSNSRLAPEDLTTPEGAAQLHYTPHDMSSFGDTFAGVAEVTLELIDKNALIDSKITSLREQAKSIRAEATARVTKIEGQINQLLAIENSPA